MKKQYLVLGDWIISKNDGDRHFISAMKLCQLYRISPERCILGKVGDGIKYPNLPTLMPRYDGDYVCPLEYEPLTKKQGVK